MEISIEIMQRDTIFYMAQFTDNRTFLNLMQCNKYFHEALKSQYRRRFGHDFRIGNSKRVFKIICEGCYFDYEIIQPTSFCKIRYVCEIATVRLSGGDTQISPLTCAAPLTLYGAREYTKRIMSALIYFGNLNPKYGVQKYFTQPKNNNNLICAIAIASLFALLWFIQPNNKKITNEKSQMKNHK
jgi:hypothetical protein